MEMVNLNRMKQLGICVREIMIIAINRLNVLSESNLLTGFQDGQDEKGADGLKSARPALINRIFGFRNPYTQKVSWVP